MFVRKKPNKSGTVSIQVVQKTKTRKQRVEMPGGQVSDIFANITKVNYLMQIADYLKVNIKIEAI